MPPTVRVTLSIDPTADLVVVDRELSVGYLRHVALLFGEASIEVGAHGHVADVELVGFIDRVQAALSELRFAAVSRMATRDDIAELARLSDGDHYAGRDPHPSPVVAPPWDSTSFSPNGHAG